MIRARRVLQYSKVDAYVAEYVDVHLYHFENKSRGEMKLSAQLESQIILEWQAQYIDYSKVKHIISKMETCVSIIENQGGEPTENQLREIKRLDLRFYDLLECEMKRAETFYAEQLLKFEFQFQELDQSCNLFLRIRGDKRMKEHILRNFVELFRLTTMLQNFAQINSVSIDKAIRKHDRLTDLIDAADSKIGDRLENLEIKKTNPIEVLQEKIEKAFELLTQKPLREVKKLLRENKKPQFLLQKKQNYMALLAGFSICMTVVLTLALIDMAIQPSEQFLSPMQRNLVRIELGAGFIMIMLGIVVWGFQYRRINYPVIFELPVTKISAGYRTIMFFGCGFMSMVLFTILLTFHCQTDAQIRLPFTNTLQRFSEKMEGNIWLMLPLAAVFLGFLISFGRIFRGKSQIAFTLCVIFYKLMTPWAHQVTFQLFYTADVLTSCNSLLKDLALLMTNQQCPDYVIFILVCIPIFIRAIQCVVRIRENNKFYPHGANLIKYLIGIPPNLTAIKIIANNHSAFLTCVILKAIDQSYKFYWDIIEDWALLWGGNGAKQFRDKKDKWQYGWFCRRPTQLSLTFIIFTILFNGAARAFTVYPLTFSSTSAQFWYSVLQTALELVRRFLWSMLRLDNQQATNCENYVAGNFVPILIPEKAQQLMSTQRMMDATEIRKSLEKSIFQQDYGCQSEVTEPVEGVL